MSGRYHKFCMGTEGGAAEELEVLTVVSKKQIAQS